jgi:hypothetical protein
MFLQYRHVKRDAFTLLMAVEMKLACILTDTQRKLLWGCRGCSQSPTHKNSSTNLDTMGMTPAAKFSHEHFKITFGTMTLRGPHPKNFDTKSF